MLYSEFLKGTKAPENADTYKQYKKIEQIYMDCEHMSKEDAYKLWKLSYGKEMKLKRKRMLDRAANLLVSVEAYNELPERDQITICRELHTMYTNAYYNRDHSKNSHFPSGMSFTDVSGIVWGLKAVGNAPNGRTIYGLFALVEGKLINACFEE